MHTARRKVRMVMELQTIRATQRELGVLLGHILDYLRDNEARRTAMVATHPALRRPIEDESDACPYCGRMGNGEPCNPHCPPREAPAEE